MLHKSTIAPLTRIEGHLKVDVVLDGGRVKDARVIGETYRGIEKILCGRRPLDAVRIVQRLCGVCHEAHGIAAARALAPIYRVEPPPNARYMFDAVLGLHLTCDHLIHFYQMTLPDYVDFSLAKDAPFFLQNGCFPDSIKSSQEVRHYLESYSRSLEMVARGGRAMAVFTGKVPFGHSIFPGGFTTRPTAEEIFSARENTALLLNFVKEVYLPDVKRLARSFPAYFSVGKGPGNLLAFGGLKALSKPVFAPGVYLNGQKEPFDPKNIFEDTKYSYYRDDRPFPKKEEGYSWVKAPRYGGRPMELTPLGRLWLTPGLKERLIAELKGLGQPEEAAFSVMGRHLARALEAEVLLKHALACLERIDPDAPNMVDVDPEADISGENTAFSQAARGDLLHRIKVSQGRVSQYNVITPTTWNFSPRDASGIPGPVEQALIGLKVSSDLREVGRVVRSFDPCMACSVH